MVTYRSEPTVSRLARVTLSAFLFTFLAARVIVLLIMTRRIPDLYAHVGETHVHHLNYGIFLLSGIGAWLIFARPTGRGLVGVAGVYGIGLALTFDEFGMWLHLGGPYWQRASFDAVVVIAALLTLIGFAPSLRRFQPKHWLVTVLMVLSLSAFGGLVWERLNRIGAVIGPKLQQIENRGPT